MAATDQYQGNTDLDNPACRVAAVVPADGADLAYVTRALYIGVGGDVVVQMHDGPAGEAAVSVTFKNALSAQILPIRVARVLSTGTTATNIVALY